MTQQDIQCKMVMWSNQYRPAALVVEVSLEENSANLQRYFIDLHSQGSRHDAFVWDILMSRAITFQEAIYGRYLAYPLGLCKGISPQNKALYGTVHQFQDPEIPIGYE